MDRWRVVQRAWKLCLGGGVLAWACCAAPGVAAEAVAPSTGDPVNRATERPRDLAEILAAGELRHLGVPYAHFVTGAGDGLDVELIQAFARELGVRYVYVPTTWETVITDATGLAFRRQGGAVEVTGPAPVRGDLIANGLTVLPWREELLSFSDPVFPTQIWLISRADDPLTPLVPSGRLDADVARTGALLRGRTVLCKRNTCLDPALFPFEQQGAVPRLFSGTLNELAPALLHGEAECTILDVPDALIALRRWSGRIKVIGPYSQTQEMAVGFPKGSTQLRAAFDEFLRRSWLDGSYRRLIEKYYPTVFEHYSAFFDEQRRRAEAAPVVTNQQ